MCLRKRRQYLSVSIRGKRFRVPLMLGLAYACNPSAVDRAISNRSLVRRLMRPTHNKGGSAGDTKPGRALRFEGDTCRFTRVERRQPGAEGGNSVAGW